MAVALPILLTDGSVVISSGVSCTDACTVTIVDSTAVLISVSASDSSTVSLTESASEAATISVADTIGIGCSDPSPSIIDPNTASIAASDALAAVFSSEVYTLNSSSTVTDTLSIGFIDSINSLQVFTGSSTNNLSVSDSLQVRLNGIAQPPPTIPISVTDGVPIGTPESILFSVSVVASESVAVRITDTSLPPSVTILGSDTVQVLVTEPSDQQPSFRVSDSVTVQSVDASPLIGGSFAFNVTDSVAVQCSESTSFGTSQVNATDSLRIAGSEVLTNSASVVESDSLAVTITEVLSAFKDISIADSLSVQIIDTAAPIFDSFIDLSASDSCTAQAAESVTELVSFLRQLTASDSAVAGLSDTIAEQFVSAMASDQLRILADGAVSIWHTPSVADSLKVGTGEAGLAIPIVPIGVSTFADDTIFGEIDGDASIEVVYEAIEKTAADSFSFIANDESRLQTGYYSDDTCLVGVSELVTKESVENATPETWNGHAGTEHRNDKPKPWKYIFTDKLNW